MPTSDMPLSIEVDLVVWIASRCPDLDGKVVPGQPEPSEVGPWCRIRRIDTKRWHHLKGHAGVIQAWLQLDFRGRDHAALRAIADKVAGRSADPGLDSFAGRLIANGFDILCSRFLRQEEDIESPEDGTEGASFIVTQEYLITFREG